MTPRKSRRSMERKRRKRRDAGEDAKGDRADRELVERFRAGDPAAFDTIFENYSPGILGFLTRMCGDPEDAKETLQDTFLAIFRYLKDFRGEATLKNWIFKIAVTACLKKKRKRSSLQVSDTGGEMGDYADCSTSSNLEVASEGFPKWGLDPEKLFLNQEFRRYVVKGVASMPYIYKVVINLRDFEGFSTQEVSKILGIKESTVKVRLHRARGYLQEWLRKRYQVQILDE